MTSLADQDLDQLGGRLSIAVSCRDGDQRRTIATEVGRIEESADRAMLVAETESVNNMAARIRAVLRGDVLAAYLDRAGETRSI